MGFRSVTSFHLYMNLFTSLDPLPVQRKEQFTVPGEWRPKKCNFTDLLIWFHCGDQEGFLGLPTIRFGWSL